MAKVIKDFKIDLSSVAAIGTTRSFLIVGDSGAVFSMEVKNAAGSYYNFSTNTFAAARSRLKPQVIPSSGAYSNSITFPTISGVDQYDISLFAESQFDTSHATYSEVRFGDGSLNINSSKGSGSNLLKRVIYQFADAVVTLSAISHGDEQNTGNFNGMTVTNDTITVGRGDNVGKTAFEITVLVGTTNAIQINRQPIVNDLTAYTAVTMGSGVIIPGEDIWAGTARSTGQTMDGDGSAITGAVMTMDVNCSTIMKLGDRVTGNTALDAKTGSSAVTVTVVGTSGDAKDFTISESITIADNETLDFTPPYYYRWSINSGSSIHKLLSGMTISPTSSSIASTTISGYKDTTTYTREFLNEDGGISERKITTTNVNIPALDPLGYKPTIVNGLVTKQLGYITFNDQTTNDLDGTVGNFYSYGPNPIKSVYNVGVKLTDLKVELTPQTTTVSLDSTDTTIPVVSKQGVINNISTISGIGVLTHPDEAPVITAGGLSTGGGDWTVGTAIILPQNTVLTVNGTSRTAVITGNIELENVDATSFTLYFDVEKFLVAS